LSESAWRYHRLDDHGLLDMDSIIAKHCAVTGQSEPENVDDRYRLHLKLLYGILDDVPDADNLEVKDGEEKSKANEPA
jgi:hypothetical protein